MDEQVLDRALSNIEGGFVDRGMDDLIVGLKEVRSTSTLEQWTSFVQSMCLTHPIRRALHQDPFTRRSFAKPRGYAGDAETLDMIYFPAETDLSEASPLGKSLFRYTTGGPASEAVRCRRRTIANAIDEMSAEVDRPRLLAVACGHMREVELSKALARGDVGELVGLDQDEASLQVVSQCYGRFQIRPVAGSVRCLLHGKQKLGDFDLVYSAGLYDYLSQDFARRLTACLFEMLKPGGRLLIANFLTGIRDVGYMESYMAWKLVLRNESEMLDLLAEVPASDISLAQLSKDDGENVVFLEAMKRR